MDQRKKARAGDGEKSHGFGEPVDGSAPFLMQQEENRGNQRASVANADPPHEIDNGEAPADRDVDAPNPHAFCE
jgi:hypothetical protein